MRKLLSKQVQRVLLSNTPVCRFTQPKSGTSTGISKVVSTVEEAISGIKSGSSILFGGYGVCGIPENVINALARKQ